MTDTSVYWLFNPQMTVSFETPIDSNGFIITAGETVAGVKRVSMNVFGSELLANQVNFAFAKIFKNLFGATFDELSTKKTLTQGVMESD